MRASNLMVKCLEREGVQHIFGIPGEETLSLMDSLADSPIHFILTRHEQGAAFMANVYGRLTGRPGVCLATLGPGATNLITGVADAQLDGSPLVAITGQTALAKTHKQAHQYIDIPEVFRPITKWNSRISRPEVIPEAVRWAFKVAQAEKPGATHLELPEDVANLEVEGEPLEATPMAYPQPNPESILQAVSLIQQSHSPIILAGHGVLRRQATLELTELVRRLRIPITHTFMGKGCIDDNEPTSLFAVGLQQRDWAMCGLERADLVIAVGYDQVEYEACHWNPDRRKKIIHIDTMPSQVDEHYIPQVEIIGDIKASLTALAQAYPTPREFSSSATLRQFILGELEQYRYDNSFPLKPQRVVAELREALGPEDILLSDVGAHKLWIARMYPTRAPNTVLISNGFASMGFALPGAIAAKLLFPHRKVVAAVGDGGFLMTAQELETAKRLGLTFVVVVWVDNALGLIEWKQINAFGRSFGVSFTNPNLEAYAHAFGLSGFRIREAGEFLPTLRRALELDLPSIIEVPVDYSENLRLTEKLGHLVCPI